MTLLDRFRTSPRHRHPDPAVRLSYVEELPIDQPELIAEVAREDEEPRVRRAAVAKLMDPAALAAVAREDADEGVRAQAVTMLRDLALEAFEGVTEPQSLAAVDALEDSKALAAIAKSATRESVAARVLERITDERTLGSTARHAALESIRVAALGRVRSADELLAIALNGEFKDAAAAVDRIDDRGALEQIAARAKQKPAAKRARAVLRERDDAAAREGAETAAAAAAPAAVDPAEIARAERAQIVQRVEALVLMDDMHAADAALRDAEATWASIDGLADPETAARFAAATSRVRERIAAARARDAERARAEAAQTRQRDEQAAGARAEAARAAEQDAARRQARLAELVIDAEAAVADADLAGAKRRLGIVRHEWKDLAAGLAVDEAIATRFAAAEAGLAARDRQVHDAEGRARRDALIKLQQLSARLESLAAKADLTLKAGERALRDVRTALADVPPLPSRKDFEEITQRLKTAQAALTPKVQEMRDAEEWRRFANVAIEEQLCAKMEALAAVEEPEEIARQIRELQQEWRQAADVPRAQAEALWRRFKTAHDAAWARCEAYFASQAEERAANLAKKTALCERVEGLADSTRWIETADEIKRLQAEWKAIGPVTRGQEKAIWERFRSACDHFFTRRQTDLADRKKQWAENLAKKEALCVRAEALAQSTDWEAAAAEIKRLQAEWKSIGPVKKSRSEAIWQRFRGACDQFFSRYAQRHEVARAERVAAREAICAEIEALAQAEGTEPPADLLAAIRAIRGRWQGELAARGVDRDRAIALDQRFAAAFAAVIARWSGAFAGTDLDPDANRRRMETLVKRIEDLAASLQHAVPAADESLSPTTRLAAMLKEALAANTIGGKVDDDSRWRAAAEEVRHAQAGWSRIGPVPDDERRVLVDRFQRACRRIQDASARAAKMNATFRPAPARR